MTTNGKLLFQMWIALVVALAGNGIAVAITRDGNDIALGYAIIAVGFATWLATVVRLTRNPKLGRARCR